MAVSADEDGTLIELSAIIGDGDGAGGGGRDVGAVAFDDSEFAVVLGASSSRRRAVAAADKFACIFCGSPWLAPEGPAKDALTAAGASTGRRPTSAERRARGERFCGE